MLLKGKNIAITGAGRGIGKSVAIAYAKEGANLGLIARTAEQLEETKKEIEALGTDVKVVIQTADVTKFNELENAFKNIEAEIGLLSGVVANAGYSSKAVSHEMDSEKFAYVMDVNVNGVFNTFKAAYPHLAMDDKKNKAQFLITGSAAYPNAMRKFAAYTASKWAIVGLQKSLSTEYKKENINFNMILPTMVDTWLLRRDKAGDGNKPPTVMETDELDDYFVFFMTKKANKLSDELADTNDLKQVEKIIADASDDKKASWDVFKPYLKEVNEYVYKNLGKLRRIVEFLLER